MCFIVIRSACRAIPRKRDQLLSRAFPSPQAVFALGMPVTHTLPRPERPTRTIVTAV